MRIRRTFARSGVGAFYCEDVAALQSGSSTPVTPGFQSVREIAQVLCVGLELENGRVAWGDCVGVSYGGKAGREPILDAQAARVFWSTSVAPLLQGVDVTSFRENSALANRSEFPMAIRYGLSQALLLAASSARAVPPVQVLREEFGISAPVQELALQGSCGNDRRTGAEKMIAHRLAALPHTQVDDLASQFGARGEVLLEYAQWVRQQIGKVGGGYSPTIHLDVHGAIGKVFGTSVECAQYLARLEAACAPYSLRVESAFVASEFEEQLLRMSELRREVHKQGLGVQLVIDEWANGCAQVAALVQAQAADMIHLKMPNFGGLDQTVEAALVCKTAGVGVLLGGSCIETDLSTRASVQVGLALQPDVFLVKPGMGIHEGVSIVRNEIARTLAWVNGGENGETETGP